MNKCCQSCGLPFNKEHETLIAKEADGSQSIYCTICYDNGAFLMPKLTIKEMIELQLPQLVGVIGTELEVRNYLNTLLPTLKRWDSK